MLMGIRRHAPAERGRASAHRGGNRFTSSTSRFASAMTSSQGLERNFPLKPGIAQKVHAWLHPSATRRYAECLGVRRCLLPSGRNGTFAAPTLTRRSTSVIPSGTASPPESPSVAQGG